MLDPINQCLGLGLTVDIDGQTSNEKGDLLTNRYSDNSILKDNLPVATKSLVEILENRLKLRETRYFLFAAAFASGWLSLYLELKK